MRNNEIYEKYMGEVYDIFASGNKPRSEEEQIDLSLKAAEVILKTNESLNALTDLREDIKKIIVLMFYTVGTGPHLYHQAGNKEAIIRSISEYEGSFISKSELNKLISRITDVHAVILECMFLTIFGIEIDNMPILIK